MKELRIKYDRGEMVITLNNFFPTSRARLKKRPSGVKLSDEELKQEKERLNTYKNATKKYLSAAKKFQRGHKQYQELLEYLTSI